MPAPQSHFEAELQQLVAEEIARLQANLQAPGTIQSYDEFRYVVGQINALDRVVNSYCDEANTLAAKR